MTRPTRSIALQGASNFRDLGGYPGLGGRTVRWRRLFRSDHLARLSAQDQQALAGLGIARAVDLRGEAERNALAYALPKDRQAKRVHVDGEVQHPGDYLLPPGSSLADALNAAGGLTPKAYLYATEFTRESVRQVQQQNFDRALHDLETDLAKNSASRRVASNEEATALSASESANARLIERLRQVRPTGRVVLPIAPNAIGGPGCTRPRSSVAAIGTRQNSTPNSVGTANTASGK
mgnify:CR=1 FL=1